MWKEDRRGGRLAASRTTRFGAGRWPATSSLWPVPTLFDDIQRSDATPASSREDSFGFLNRVASPWWGRQRELLEAWYADFPDGDGDLRSRFRSSDPAQHFGAWWELYVHALLSALGYTLIHHPPMPDTTSTVDFLASRGDESFYVEAVHVLSSLNGAPSAAVADLISAIEEVDASNFWVALRLDSTGANTPPLSRVKRDITEWVGGLDPDRVDFGFEGARAAERQFIYGDWAFTLSPYAWAPEHRGRTDNPFVGLGPATVGNFDDVERLRNAVRRKTRHYGVPDKPLLVAVLLLNGFSNDRHVVDALFGKEVIRLNIETRETSVARNGDGGWLRPSGPTGELASGILVGNSIQPHSVATAEPTLWHHPAAARPLGADLPFRTLRVVDGQLQTAEGTFSASAVFALSAEWPGPGEAFPRAA